jgi:hypothetical protein
MIETTLARSISTVMKFGITTPSVKRMGVNEELVKEIHSSDQDIYPAPLTYGRLKSWIDACPELSISYKIFIDESGNPTPLAGVLIALPIKPTHWKDLLVGNLKEWNILPSMFATNDQKSLDVGIHIFHIEKYNAWNKEIGKVDGRRSFAEMALGDVAEIVEKKGWKILGYSGLCSFLLPNL